MLRKRVRTIKFEGDISLYVNELAVVSFMGVKHTSDWYLPAFKESGMASGEFFFLSSFWEGWGGGREGEGKVEEEKTIF